MGNTLQILAKLDKNIDFERGSTDLEGLLREVKFDQENTLEEARKLLSAKTKEKIEFGKAAIINSTFRPNGKLVKLRFSAPTCIKKSHLLSVLQVVGSNSDILSSQVEIS